MPDGGGCPENMRFVDGRKALTATKARRISSWCTMVEAQTCGIGRESEACATLKQRASGELHFLEASTLLLRGGLCRVRPA